MTTAKPTWCVQATADEPAELLCAFAAHHLALGAAEIILHLDHDDPAAAKALAGRPGVTVIPRRTGGAEAPGYHTHRQRINAREAYAACRHDWIVTIDADEFLLPRRPMEAILSGIPEAVNSVRVPVLERAFVLGAPIRSIFDGVWRTPLRAHAPVMGLIYGPGQDFLTHGLLGHSLGKAMTRAGRDMVPDLHIAFPAAETAKPKDLYGRPEYDVWAPDVRLLHFYAMTPTHYLLKMLRKMVNWQASQAPSNKVLVPAVDPARKRQYRRIYKNSSDPAVMAEMSRLLFLSAGQRTALRMLGALRTPAHSIEAAATARFPGIDLSPRQFDMRLRDRHADLIEATRYAAPVF